MSSRYLAPSPSGSGYSSAASSPYLSSNSSAHSYSPMPSPHSYEELAQHAYQPPRNSYFDHPDNQERILRPPRGSSVSSFNQIPALRQHELRDLRGQRSFHGQQVYSQYAQHAPPPPPQHHLYQQQQQQHPPPTQHHYQQRRPAPLRADSLPSAAHLPSALHRPSIVSPAGSTFSAGSYQPSHSSSGSFQPFPPSSPYAQQSFNSSTVSLGLAPAVLPLSPSEPSHPSSSPSTPIPQAGEGDWAYGSVVSPSLLLTLDPTTSRNRNHKEVVFRDAQTSRPLYIAREFRRSKTGQLLNGVEAHSDGLVWPEWHDGLEEATHEAGGQGEGAEKGSVEFLLLEYPSSNAQRRAFQAGEHAEPTKLGLVTEEVLYLRGGKKVAWRRFYKKSFFGSSGREGTWKGVDGKKYRWSREERKGAYEGEAVISLIDEKTKEIMVVAHEVDGKPTQLILSALVLPSLQPVLLTLLHRSYADAAKRLRDDLREFEDEEGRAW
ncbi:hypothetical protein JCM8547_008966 [Rhodosporidiobolus lusitaniae]